MEGIILGTIGALIASFALWGVFATWRGQLLARAAGIVDAGDLHFLPATVVAGLVLGGAAIGCLGGALAARGTR
jgi:cell division protein FtsX